MVEVLVFYHKVLFQTGQFFIPYDFESYHLPLAEFIASSLRRGELPLWDPFPYCGMPFYADLTAQVFYPPTLAAVLVSNWIGGGNLRDLMEWQLVLHVFLGGVFTYFLLRRIGTDVTGALVGATIYQLGAFFASQTQHLGAIDAAAWLPFAWWGVGELAERFTWRWTALLAIALSMTVLAGFPAVTAVIYGSCILLAAFSVRGFARVVLAAAWSLLLAAVQLIPTMELTRLSVAKYRSDWLGNGGGLPLQSLVSLVMPNYYGVLHFDPAAWRLPWNPTFLYLYCGIPALIFVATALLLRPNRRARQFGILTMVCVFWMLGASTPVFRIVFRLLPEMLKSFLYHPLPRFFLVDRVRHANDLQGALASLRTPGIDLRHEAVVEVEAASKGSGLVRVLHYDPHEVSLEIEAANDSFLVTSEAYYPGWRARVDEADKPLVVTNVAFRGLPVPAGRHRVTMRFEPAILRWSAVISAAAWLAILLCFRRARTGA